jgi:hypothetical protein
MYVQMQTRRRRLGDAPLYDPSGDLSFAYPEQSANNVPLPRPAACSFLDYIWPSQACSLALGQQQIQSVPSNAAAANAAAAGAGLPAPYSVPQIQAVADQQTAAFSASVPSLFATAATLNDPSTWPWYYWAGLAFGAFLLVEAVKR